nr:hypothetical protein [Tanacetum cinerariifolium]
MNDSSSYSNTSNLDDIHNIDLVMQLINQDHQVQGESSRFSRNAINRERDVAEARLMADYFGSPPKYPDYYFRRRYRMNRSLFLKTVQAGANTDLTVLNHSSLFNDLLDYISLVVPYEVNGVTFEKGYYLADGIYPHRITFVKSFTVARDKRCRI